MTHSNLQTSLQSVVEQSIIVEVPFLSTADALRDLTSEIRIFTAMYLYRRCKILVASNQEATSSNQVSDVGNNVQPLGQQQDQRVRMILDEMAQILQDVGYDPQPDGADELLEQFSLLSTGYLLAKINVQDASQTKDASRTNEAPPNLDPNTTILEKPTVPANLTDTVPSSPHENL